PPSADAGFRACSPFANEGKFGRARPSHELAPLGISRELALDRAPPQLSAGLALDHPQNALDPQRTLAGPQGGEGATQGRSWPNRDGPAALSRRLLSLAAVCSRGSGCVPDCLEVGAEPPGLPL